MIKTHGLPYDTFNQLESSIKTISAKVGLESTGADELIKSFNPSELDAILEKLELENEPSKNERQALFDTKKYQTLKKLIQADAITNVVQLERKLKDERYIFRYYQVQ